MRIHQLAGIAAVLLLLPLAAAEAATYYVATSGNDTNPGTQALPFRTIAKGVATAVDGDSVQVGAGTYAEHVAWSTKGLVLQGAGAGQSIIDGGGNGTCLALTSVPAAGRIEGFTFQNGAASSGAAGGLTNNGNGSPTVIRCAFNNHTGSGTTGLGAFTTAAGDPILINCTFSNNTVSAVVMSGGTLTVSGSTFTNNRGFFGGAMDLRNGTATVTACVLRGNSSATFNNQVGLKNAIINLINSVIVDTSTVTGEVRFALEAQPGGAYILNSTITGTQAFVRGQNGSSLEMRNSILRGSDANNHGIATVTGSTALVTHSNVANGFPGQGNIAADPLFVNAAAANYRLQSTSPCRDTGFAFVLPPTDLEGVTRITGTRPDMGAHEFWTSASGSWFVDKALGNDTTGAGSPGAPFKTVVKAIAVASAGHSINFKQGNYGTDRPRITKNLKFNNWTGLGRASIGKP